MPADRVRFNHSSVLVNNCFDYHRSKNMRLPSENRIFRLRSGEQLRRLQIAADPYRFPRTLNDWWRRWNKSGAQVCATDHTLPWNSAKYATWDTTCCYVRWEA